MANPSLAVDWKFADTSLTRLQKLIPDTRLLPPAQQKFVAEIAMIRMFLLLDNTFASVAAKLLSGAQYLDNSAPKRLATAASVASARVAMRTLGRQQPKRYLTWTQSKTIRDNLVHTMHSSDPYFGVIRNHATLLTELRFIRNHIAHGNSGTRADFRKVVVQHYGGLKRGVTPGLLLLTQAFGSTCLLERHLVSSRVLVRELVRA